MALEHVAEHASSELERVEAWRASELIRAGYPTDAALELAARADIDLHDAVQLLARGCAPQLAARILL